ncbi:MAG: hypothetical protein SFV81_20315 [Pirellulaceae bacterium]|nr:hypothetical protein [Pirellulaceae bacterium]
MLNQNPNAVELDPWLVVLGSAAEGSLAMWRLADEKLPTEQQITVALFSTEQRATDYAEKCCDAPYQLIQVDRTRFLSLMVDCFRQGIRYATLNPGDSTAQSLFVLRDVLSAAKREFAKQ